jgi:hypothetical protein
MMKSVTFSEIERIQQDARPLSIVQPGQGLATFALSLALGLPALVIAFHLLDPTAPLSYIVLPILLGIVLPIARALPGRFQVATRFSACHLIGTLDTSLESLGYAPTERGPGTLRYRARGARFAHWKARDVAVTVRDHTLEVIGPVRTLRALRRQMAC